MSREAVQRQVLNPILKIVRPVNVLIIILTQYFTAIFLIGPRSNWQQYLFDLDLFLICLATVMIAAAGYIINDYYDIKIDLVNKPEKVVVGTIVDRRVAMFIHTMLNLVGIFLGLLVSPLIAIINFIAAFSLWLYSNQLKRLPFIGNFTVAVLTGMAIFVIAIHYDHNYTIVLLYALFAFLVNLGREIIKDIEDIKGDQRFGSRTLPILFGIRRTKIMIYLLSVTFILFVGYLVLSSKFPGKDIILYLFIAPIFILNYLLYRSDTKRDFNNLSQYSKWFMLVGIASMIFVS